MCVLSIQATKETLHPVSVLSIQSHRWVRECGVKIVFKEAREPLLWVILRCFTCFNSTSDAVSSAVNTASLTLVVRVHPATTANTKWWGSIMIVTELNIHIDLWQAAHWGGLQQHLLLSDLFTGVRQGGTESRSEISAGLCLRERLGWLLRGKLWMNIMF
jgi:hypothetical protein